MNPSNHARTELLIWRKVGMDNQVKTMNFIEHINRTLLFTSILLFLALSFATSNSITLDTQNPTSNYFLTQDTSRPDIYRWGIDGEVNLVDTFVVWANVSDTDSGILNVSTVIRLDANSSLTYRTLMSFNGSYYTQSFSPLEVNHTYSIWIDVYDNAFNRAQSYNRLFDLHVFPNTRVDPSVTLPYVLTGSLATFLVAFLLAREYQKRNPRVEVPSMGSSESELASDSGETS